VVDGDTVEIHGKRIRLFGIDAVESGQRCQKDGKPWFAGGSPPLPLPTGLGSEPSPAREASSTDTDASCGRDAVVSRLVSGAGGIHQ